MSEENVELVRRALNEFKGTVTSGELSGLARWLREFADPAIEYEPAEEAAVVRGHDGMLDYWRRWFEVWDDIRWEVEEVIDAGDRVVAAWVIGGRGKGSGVEGALRGVHVYDVRNEKLGRIWEYPGRDEALEAAAELVHPDAEWIPDRRVGQGPVRGREKIIQFVTDRVEMFDEFRQEPERFWETDDKVLVFVRVTGRGGASGAEFDIRIGHLWTVRDGVVVRGEGYGDRAEALEAAGLSE